MARILLIGTSKMGYQERDLMRMTPGKFFTLFDAWIDLNDVKGNAKKKRARNSRAGLDIDGLP